MTTDSPEGRSDTAIGSPAFDAAKEAARARGWIMEPSVISYMLAAAYPLLVGPLLERLDRAEAELEKWRKPCGDCFVNEEIIAGQDAELAAAQARADDYGDRIDAAVAWARSVAQARADDYGDRIDAAVAWARSVAHEVDVVPLMHALRVLAGDAARPLPEPEQPPRLYTLEEVAAEFGFEPGALSVEEEPDQPAVVINPGLASEERPVLDAVSPTTEDSMSDRQVHARLASGSEVVRYNRAGKWYLEHSDGGRCRLTLDEAVKLAARPSSARYWNRPGGKSFDARLRRVVGGGS